MKVTVIDREAMDAQWGQHGYLTPVLREVEISGTCPVCGGPRGEPNSRRTSEEGMVFDVDVWRNPCGHVDKYRDVLVEAKVKEK